MKATMKTAGLISIFLLLFSCHDDCCTMVDTGVDVLVKDRLGNNLLSASTPSYYVSQEIRIFDVDKGAKTQVVNSQMKRFEIVTTEGNEPVLRLYPRGVKANGQTTMVSQIEWRIGDEDEIETTVEKTKHSSHCSKVKHNGVLKYDSQSAKGRRIIEIVKAK